MTWFNVYISLLVISGLITLVLITEQCHTSYTLLIVMKELHSPISWPPLIFAVEERDRIATISLVKLKLPQSYLHSNYYLLLLNPLNVCLCEIMVDLS